VLWSTRERRPAATPPAEAAAQSETSVPIPA
jgi:hypothetical protein